MDRRTLLGKINYAGYSKSAGVTHDGKPLPAWSDLAEKTQEFWIAGAESVIRAYLMEEEASGTECRRNRGPEDHGETGPDAARVGDG